MSDWSSDVCSSVLASASIDRMVERQRFRDVGRSVVVRIDPATPECGGTLFGRLGRHLLDLKRRGLIATLAPLDPSRGAGFNLTLPASRQASEPEPGISI